jgi:hypothetical protein
MSDEAAIPHLPSDTRQAAEGYIPTDTPVPTPTPAQEEALASVDETDMTND